MSCRHMGAALHDVEAHHKSGLRPVAGTGLTAKMGAGRAEAYFAVLTSLRNSVIQSSEPMPRHSPIMLNPVRAKLVPVQA